MAWAAIARSRYDALFYSTSADNLASQGVARRLGLRPIGWIWQLRG
jgi:RimJ/RimL family protein N-acetyltransferase